MRYEFIDHEWIAIKPMLPNKPRGVPRSMTGVSSTASSGCCDLEPLGATYLRRSAHTPPATIASFAGGGWRLGTDHECAGHCP
jgi:transposase